MYMLLSGRPSHSIRAMRAVTVGVMMMASVMRIYVIAFIAIAAYNIHAMLLIVAVMMII
jgi:hypothetical protein